MRLALASVLLVAACGSWTGAPAAEASPDRTVRKLVEVERYHRLAVPIVALDDHHWIGGGDQHDLVEYDRAREVRRFPGSAQVLGGSLLRAVPGGGLIAGSSLHAADGTVRWSGYGWAQRYGRFGSPKAIAFDAEARVAIVDGADSPSTCLCDRERGTGGSSKGALVRLTFGSEGEPTERVLVEHPDRREFRVAASARWVAAAEGRTLSVWPATGDDPPVTTTLDASLRRLDWAGERYLIASRWLDTERTQITVLDREHALAPTATWTVDGQLQDLAIRPGDRELAVAITRYVATDKVYADERRVEVYGLDGTRRAQVDTPRYPASLSWTPRGDALLVSCTGLEPSDQVVIRFAVR